MPSGILPNNITINNMKIIWLKMAIFVIFQNMAKTLFKQSHIKSKYVTQLFSIKCPQDIKKNMNIKNTAIVVLPVNWSKIVLQNMILRWWYQKQKYVSSNFNINQQKKRNLYFHYTLRIYYQKNAKKNPKKDCCCWYIKMPFLFSTNLEI